MVQPTIVISLVIINWILDQLSIIVLDLFIIVILSIDNQSKKWIIVPPINIAMFVVYIVMWSCLSLFILKKNSWISLMTFVLLVLASPPTYYNNWLVEFISMIFYKKFKLFKLYFLIMIFFKIWGNGHRHN